MALSYGRKPYLLVTSVAINKGQKCGGCGKEQHGRVVSHTGNLQP